MCLRNPLCIDVAGTAESKEKKAATVGMNRGRLWGKVYALSPIQPCAGG